MKILIVSGFFYPQNTPRAFRTAELAKEFARLGHEVKVYFPQSDFDYSAFKQENPNIQIAFIPSIGGESPKGGMRYKLWRLANIFMSYPSIKYFKILKTVLKDEKEYDLLISVAVPHPIHWGIGRIYKNRKIAKTWIADCGDPYMLCKTDSHNAPRYMRYFEDLWCKKCDYITVPTDTSYTGYYPEYHSKIRVIPQGFNFDSIELPVYSKNDVPTFIFAGIFIKGKRDPHKLMKFLVDIDKPFCFKVFGSNNHQFLDEYKNKLGDKLQICNPLPRTDLLQEMAKADFLINIGNGTNVQTPSKLIDYTLVKRPYLTIETDDIKEDILLEFLNGNYEHHDPDIDISRYDIHNVAQQFISLCK